METLKKKKNDLFNLLLHSTNCIFHFKLFILVILWWHTKNQSFMVPMISKKKLWCGDGWCVNLFYCSALALTKLHNKYLVGGNIALSKSNYCCFFVEGAI